MSLDKGVLDTLVLDYKEKRAKAEATAPGAELAALEAFQDGMEHALKAFDVPFKEMVASDDLAEQEPKFRINLREPVTVDEALVIIGWARKQSESIHEDAPELRDLLNSRYLASVFKDERGPGIRFHCGGLFWQIWRHDEADETEEAE